ncbi:unnamed protein product [Owenia fusiformis]|uniref:Uncharacterized protein n=1 Tax=Owenia fusiformis TaxID=6347 RepID=A0A8J1ULC1_OWEFU|nr:unnamed protein product [Owenia fusiformis]
MQKFTTSGPQLMKHLALVTELYQEKKGWRYYDCNFRNERAEGKWPWNVLHFQHWTTAKAMINNDITQGSQEENRDFRFPKGWCFQYHRGRFCNNKCGYKHTCPKCDEQHRGCYCTRERRPGGPQRQSKEEHNDRKRDYDGNYSSKR